MRLPWTGSYRHPSGGRRFAPAIERVWEALRLAAYQEKHAGRGRGGRPAARVREIQAGRPVTAWNPLSLGIHRAIGGQALPAYVLRDHDRVLRQRLRGRPVANQLIVLRGGPSTGKSRAAYEGLKSEMPSRSVLFPRTVTSLAANLDQGIAPRTVVWLGELRHYAESEAGQEALAKLDDLLFEQDGIVIITTLWPDYWKTFTEGQPDRYLQSRLLLVRVEDEVIDIPGAFSARDLTSLTRDGTPAAFAAAEAASAAGRPGEVTQFLAGVPDLINHYSGPGADPYGRALITAAMDASRLRHGNSEYLPLDAWTGHLVSDNGRCDLVTAHRCRVWCI
jgi:hypothetical protein